MTAYENLEELVASAMAYFAKHPYRLEEKLENFDNSTMKMFMDMSYKLGRPAAKDANVIMSNYEDISYDTLFQKFKKQIQQKYPDHFTT